MQTRVAFSGRLIGLGLLLLAELLVLTVSFDTQGLNSIPTVWAQMVNWAPQYLRLALTIVITLAILVAIQRPADIRTVLTRKPPRVRVTAFVVHGAALGLFALATATVVSTGATYNAHPALWTLAWWLTGLATLVSWSLLLFSWRMWLSGIGRRYAVVSLGVGAGSVIWASGFVTEVFWLPLARYTLGLVAWILGFFYPTVVSVPHKLLIGTPAFKVTVAPSCSGYEGVGLILAFLTLYLWLNRKELRFPSALLLLPLGAVVVWLVNAVRIALLIVIGTAGWKAVALSGFHSQAGWIAFSAIALSFVAAIHSFGYFRAETHPAGTASVATVVEEGDVAATTAYLGPFLVITAATMITGAFSAGFDWLYPVRVFAAGAVLWIYRNSYANLKWSWSWWSFAIGLATFIVWLALIPEASSRNATWAAALGSVPVQWAAAWMVLRVVGYVVTAPLAEELAFRGFLTRRILRSDFQNLPVGVFSWSSFVISSVLFGAFHGSLWLPGTIAGMSFALALYRRGALGEAVWAHSTTNGLIALYAWSTGNWWAWS